MVEQTFFVHSEVSYRKTNKADGVSLLPKVSSDQWRKFDTYFVQNACKSFTFLFATHVWQ